MNSFLAVGECMVELAQMQGNLYRRGFAGDTFNTAWYARRLLPADWQVSYASCIGNDAASDEMARFIAAQGIDTAALRRVPDRTVGLYMISLDEGERSFSYWRGQSAARLLAEDGDWLARVLAGHAVIYLSAITLAILPPDGRTRLCDAMRVARTQGALVAFDTNLRPSLWESGAAMRAGLMRAAEVADLVLPSFDEEAALFEDATPGQTVARYRAAGARSVIVKNRGRPITGFAPDCGDFSFAPVPVARVVDSTAAGDSFAAALLAGLATGKDMLRSVRAAAELAAKVIGAPGALVRSSVPGAAEGRGA
ncbi:2-dehydro-3-deoxygluconokinase [Defluviimonas sp. 20V17]|uniref:2-dehydro-3-deoxygluconokinase n=1 Tax=Allgaiera indica TaxID=765699 RepID=A0AAN4UUG8_9RHOB|nr:sugar kinase [Allgaiera indica]KDB04790.1 2-dehydro-3-deoxygluconokinase [Defluviimonas sp. 20V17]GHE05101.1 2-dehydro-3-deoxygluconokinase [Allgaiera indica]SDX66681.1 2-keto-3-deoxygluconate kinase [Allgaiera indica]